MPSPQQQEEVSESVLKDILDELDRERSRRAELEDIVRKLQDEKSVLEDSQRVQDERTRTAESLQVSFHSFIAMETKLEGFQQIVDTLTRGKPAIAAAMAAEQKTPASASKTTSLPVHVVRLLEVVPWDPRAQQHIRKEETIIEWQVYRDGAWKGQLGLFPPMLRTLRVSSSSSSEGDNNSDLRTFFANVERQAMRKKLDRVLTDASVTMLYETDAGYALPSDYGSWQWAGGWKIQQHQQSEAPQVLCDDDGWSYAKKPQEFMRHEPAISDTSGATAEATSPPPRPYRRRFWSRQRVLVDYQFASEPTKQYLKMVAETTRLAFTADKINEQLVETKSTLTETERLLCEARSDTTKTTITGGVVELKEVGSEMGNDSGRSKTSTETTKTIGTLDLSVGKLSQWVQATRKTSEDMTISDESLEEGSISVGSSHGSVSTETAPDKFDWKRFSRGTIQKWKTQQQVIRNPHFNIQGNPLFRKMASNLDPAAAHMVDSDEDDEL